MMERLFNRRARQSSLHPDSGNAAACTSMTPSSTVPAEHNSVSSLRLLLEKTKQAKYWPATPGLRHKLLQVRCNEL